MKILKTGVLATLLLALTVGSGMHLVHALHEPKSLDEVSLTSFTIDVVKDDAVNIDGLPANAAAGTRVDFSLTYDSSTYRVDHVLVNDEKPVKRAGDAYSFRMPEKAVTITVVGECLETELTTYSILNLDAEKNVVLKGLPATAKADDVLTFSVEFGWNSGYSFNNHVSVFKVDDEGEQVADGDVECTFNASSKTFSFVMPDHDVAVDVETITKKFTLTRDSVVNANINSLKYSVDGGVTYVANSSNTLNLLYGTKIQLTLKNSDSLIPMSLALKTNNGLVDVPLNELVAEFDMPASNVSFVIDGEINYKPIAVSNTEHLTITILEESEEGYTPVTDLTHFVPNETVYFKVESDDEDVIVNSVKVTYNGYSTISPTTVDATNQIYSFTMKNSDDVTITVTEKNVGLYKNYPFVGTFYGYNLYGSTATGVEKTCNSSYGLKINGAGEVFKGTATTTVTTITSLSQLDPESQNGLIQLSTGNNIIYTPNFVLSHYSLSNTFANNFNNDFLLATKSVDDSDTLSNYRLTHLWNKANFLAVQSYRVTDDGTTYLASFFVDFVNKEYYGENLSFVLADDSTTIASTSSTFDVVVNGVTIGTVANNVYTKAAQEEKEMKANKKINIFTLLALACLVSSCGPKNDVSSTSTNNTPSTSVLTPDSSTTPSTSVTPPSSSSDAPSSDSSVVDPVVHVESLSIDKESVTLEEGTTETVTVEVLPENATDKSYTFVVANPDIASISENGEILGIKEGTTSITASATDGGVSDVVMVHVFHNYAVTVNAPAGVNVEVVSQAKAGELVYVDLTYDTTALVVDSVLANDVELGTEDGRYYFYMPSEDVEITVTASPYVYYYQVISKQTGMVHLETTGAYAVGEQVSIPFTVLPGYQFNGTVKVYKNLTAFDPMDRIEVTSSIVNGLIQFAMPNENVEIELDITASIFTISKDDAYSHISSLKADDSTVYATNDTYDAKYGQTIKVNFVYESSTSCVQAKPTGIYIPEMELTVPMESNAATFVMPYYDVTIKVLTTPVYRNMTLVASEHIAIEAYLRVDDEYVLITESRAVYGDKVYLKLTSTDESLYQVRSVQGVYNTQDYSYTSYLYPVLEDDGYYSFTMPQVDLSKTLTITITEKDMTLFTDAPFIGNYLGVELYSSYSSLTAFSSKQNTVIDSSGLMVQGDSSSTIKENTIREYVSETNTLNITNYEDSDGVAYYKDNLIASHWRYSGTQLVTTDMIFLIKKLNATDEDSLYTFSGVYVGANYYFGQAWRDGVLYQTFLADIQKQTVESNPEFVFETGTKVTDSDATYDVYVNDKLIYHVDNKTTVSSYDGLQGTYTNAATEELVIDGLGKATYAGASYTYMVKEDGTVSMQRLLETSIEYVVVSLDGETFEVISLTTEDFAPVYSHNFYGKTSWSFYIHIVFDRPGNCKVYVLYDANTTDIPTYASYGYDWNATYTYDSATSTIVVTTASNGAATFTLSGEAGSYVLTCTASSMSFAGGSLNVDTALNEFVIG